MSSSRSIRTRLTLAVAGVFAAVTLVGAWAIYNVVEDQLLEGAWTNSVTLLDRYLSNSERGGPILAVTAPDETGTFFYLDADGNELTPKEYIRALTALGPGTADDGPGSVNMEITESTTEQPENGPPAGEEWLTLVVSGSERVGEIGERDRGEDVIAAAQRVRFDGGAEFQIGVATPLAPIEESLAAIRWVMWIAAPVLVALVALLTYITANRALRPVHSITRRTRSITDANLSERVPVPESGDDIAELATTMNDMLDRLDGSQQRQRRFIADASHELRSPVAASKTQLEVALTHPEAADWEQTARRMLEEHEHLGDFIDDLLALSRLDETGLGTMTEVDIGKVIDEVTPTSAPIHIITKVEGDVAVFGDRNQMERALRNLVENAVRHANGQVTVTAKADSGICVITVDDDGVGIPEGSREEVFDRFTRLDDGRTRTDGGAGLGLAIVRRIIDLHNGKVTCTDSPLGGARFTIELPAV